MKKLIIGMLTSLATMTTLSAEEFPKLQDDHTYGYANVQAGAIADIGNKQAYLSPGVGLGFRQQVDSGGLDLSIGSSFSGKLNRIWEARTGLLFFSTPSTPADFNEWYAGIGGALIGSYTKNPIESGAIIPTVGKKLGKKSFVQLDGYIPVNKQVSKGDVTIYPAIRTGFGF